MALPAFLTISYIKGLLGRSLLLGAIALTLVNCSRPSSSATDTETASPQTLQIFWNQGFYPEEDQALQKIIDDWEAETNITVELSFYSSDDILNQTTVALENGEPPDIVFAHRADYTLQPRWAWDGRLVDVSDVIEPYQDSYTDAALEAAYLYNHAEDKRGYYGVPIEQQTIHIHYWRNLLEDAGFKDTEIPQDWESFWAFWAQAQDSLQQKGVTDVYGLGLTLSIQGSDTYYFFEQVLDAYDVELFTEDGEFQGDDPIVQQKIQSVLDWTAQFYENEYVPEDAVTWLDSDNNVKFLNQETLMTPNPTLSIPASQRADENLYLKNIATLPFPNEPDGDPMSYLASIKQALIFTDAQNPEAAKEFLSYLLQPERLNTYVKGSLGRWFPVMNGALDDPFWTDSTDPHISVAVQQFTQSPTRPFYHALNPAYSEVQAENIWGQAIERVVIDGESAEAATGEAIASIQKILAEWEEE